MIGKGKIGGTLGSKWLAAGHDVVYGVRDASGTGPGGAPVLQVGDALADAELVLLAVYRNDVRRVVDQVPELLDAHAPLEAFRVWFTRLGDYVRVKHGLGEAMSRSAAAQHVINETYAPVTQAVATLLEACVANGSVRSGLDPADVLLLMGFLWRTTPDEAGRAQASHGMEIVIVSLSPRG